MRVVVVEDDDSVADAVTAGLLAHGFGTVDRLSSGLDLLTAYRDYDSVILDLGLPDINGYRVLRQLRKVSSIPVVVLTAEQDEIAAVTCLRAGADDYVVKPPRIGELAARLEAIARRADPAGNPAVLETGDVYVDLAARTVAVAGLPVSLTQKEFAVVALLAGQAGVAISRDAVMTKIWGAASPSISRSLDVHIGTLRSKLNRPGLIATIHGFGYRWS